MHDGVPQGHKLYDKISEKNINGQDSLQPKIGDKINTPMDNSSFHRKKQLISTTQKLAAR